MKKANQVLGILKKTYYTRDAKTIACLYKAMVRPHLEYGNTIWGPFYKGDIKLVESVQRRATKIIPELRDKPYEERLRKLRLPSLTHRRRRGDMIQMYKVVKGIVRIDMSKFFSLSPLSHTRGHSFKMFRSHAVKVPRTNSFSQRVIKDWNCLPSKIVNAPTLDYFKALLDEHWISIQYDITE